MTSPLLLSAREKRALQALVASEATSARSRLRVLAVLLSAQGLSSAAVADSLGVSDRAVRLARARWRRHGLDGLHDAARSGRPALVSPAYLRRLVRLADQDPRDQGYAFSRWTAPRLAAHLTKVTGISVSDRWIRQLLLDHDLVWRRTKRTLRNLQDPVLVSWTHKALQNLKKSLSHAEPRSSCGSAMA